MAHFRLPHSKLFPGGTRLFVTGNSGQERLVLQIGQQVTLELAELANPSAASSVMKFELPNLLTEGMTAESLRGVWDTLTAGTVAPDIVTVSAPVGPKRQFTVKAMRAGVVVLVAEDANLLVAVGDFKNHDGFARDLIADVFRGSDAAKMHVLTRTLFSNVDNLFNEESEDNQRHWCKNYPPHRCLPCGSVAKAGSQLIFNSSVNYDYQPYTKSIPGMGTATARSNLKRTDVKYDNARLKRGCEAIQKRLAKGLPSIVGLVYDPSTVVQANGSLNETGDGGHSVPIVGCNAAGTDFLYIDVFQNGSKLKYLGGHAGKSLFANECNYLGVFELRPDPARGCNVLRARAGTAGPSNVFSDDQFLEVVSGPLNA